MSDQPKDVYLLCGKPWKCDWIALVVHAFNATGPERDLVRLIGQNRDRLEYFVISPQGQEYGPADIAVLQQWIAESRIGPDTLLRPASGGATVAAGLVPGLFPPSASNVPPPIAPGTGAASYAAYPQADYSQAPQYAAPKSNDGMGVIWGVIIRSALGVVLFFAFHGFGVVFSGYALYYAFQAKQSGHRYGNVALAIAGASTVAVVVGWILRLSGSANI